MAEGASKSFYLGIGPIRCGAYTVSAVIRVDMKGFISNGGLIFFADLVPDTLGIFHDEGPEQIYSWKCSP
ncbi:MAG: hypothetical protein DIU66_006760 [Bacillota bacterium]|nr:MAG: hypothetical protein DIU66_09475 [Bacillota bacterium]